MNVAAGNEHGGHSGAWERQLRVTLHPVEPTASPALPTSPRQHLDDWIAPEVCHVNPTTRMPPDRHSPSETVVRVTRRSTHWIRDEGRDSDSVPPRIFVVDRDRGRRLLVVRLLSARSDLCVVGDHIGCAGVMEEMVSVVPHVVVVGTQPLPARAADLLEEIDRALPATRCVRLPSVPAGDISLLTLARRARMEDDLAVFVVSVLQAAGLPTSSVEPDVRLHIRRSLLHATERWPGAFRSSD